MKQGDFVLVDYPYSDGTGTKVRPAIIVQCDAKNIVLADTVIALITSRLHRWADTHVFVDIATSDGQQTGLRRNSLIQCENLYTIDKRKLVRVLGHCPDSMLLEVKDAIRRTFGL